MGLSPICGAFIKDVASAWVNRVPRKDQSNEFMVGGTRIELVTPSMSTKCSTAELTAHETVA